MTGKIKLDLDVIGGENFAAEMSKAIRKGITQAAPEIAEEAEDAAKLRLDQAGAYWRGVLHGSFDWNLRVRSNRYTVEVMNTAEHARPIEFGAEYEEKGPPLFSLIPWVVTKMVGFKLDRDDMKSIPDADEISAQAEVEYDGESMSVDLANYTDQETLQKAFWLQQHIKEEGIDAIRFMRAARQQASQSAEDTVMDHIERELRRL